MTPNEAGEVVKYLLAGFPAQRQRMSQDDVRGMVAFYCANLADLEAVPVRAAIDRLAKTAEFIPTVAKIREAVGAVHHGEQAPAAIAWGEVHDLMRKKGYYRTPGVDFEITDPIAREVVRSIGWEDMCTGAQDHIRARFFDAYDQASKLARKSAQQSPGAKNPALGAPRSHERIEGPRTLAHLLPAIPDDPEEE